MYCKLISHDKTLIAELTVKDYHAVPCFSLIFGSIVGKSTETCMLVFHSAWPCSQDKLAEDKTSQELFSHQDNQLKVAALSGSGEGGLHVKKSIYL